MARRTKPAPGPSWSVSPQEWGARINYDSWNDRWYQKDKVAGHYGGNPNYAGETPHSRAKEEKLLRGWEAYHVDGRGYRGIAYGWAIGMTGTVYRLRGWNNYGATKGDVDKDGIPANLEAIPVVFLCGKGQRVTQAAWTALDKLRRYFEAEMDERLRMYGHREFKSTHCPGDIIQAHIERNRYLAEKPTPDPDPGPDPTPTPDPPEAERPVQWPDILEPNTRHDCVPDLRCYLFVLGYLKRTLVPDSTLYSTWLSQYVRKFQEDRNLTVDGIIGPQTRGAISDAVAETME